MIAPDIGVRGEAAAPVLPVPPPAIGPTDQMALLRIARSAVAHRLGLPVETTLPAMSAALARRTDPVFVAFWVDGRMRGCRGAAGRALHRNVLDATLKTLTDERVDRLTPADVDRLRIEIDVLGAPAAVSAGTVAELAAAIEPGIDGVTAEAGGRRALYRSSVAITKNWRVEELVRRLCEKGGWAPDAYVTGMVALSRFRSTAFIDAPKRDRSLPLWRANCLVGPADWSRQRIAAAIHDGADYLRRAQRPDGGFVYEYNPTRDACAPGDHIVRQLATTWIAAELSRRPDAAPCRDILTRALPFLFARMRPAPTHTGGLVVSDVADVAVLGASAFALLTLLATADDGFKDVALRLADAILSLQRPDGGFHTEFPAATRSDAENFYPGEALLALMHLHARHPDPRYPSALRRALPYYRAHFRAERASALIPWQAAAYAEIFRVTGEREYSDWVFELADAIVPLQYVGASIPYPDYAGGYRAKGPPGIPSATYNEGVLDAYDVAVKTGDHERAARYQRAGLLAALFTLRLQFTADNAYYIERPDRALGAFRASLGDAALRIDHTQHAVNSLIKAERYLFGGLGRPPGAATARTREIPV